MRLFVVSLGKALLGIVESYKAPFTNWKILEVWAGPFLDASWYWKDMNVSRVMPASGGRATVRAERIVGIGRE